MKEPIVIKASGCFSCPMRRNVFDGGGGPIICRAVDPMNYVTAYMGKNKKPAWCPLKQQPIRIELNE